MKKRILIITHSLTDSGTPELIMQTIRLFHSQCDFSIFLSNNFISDRHKKELDSLSVKVFTNNFPNLYRSLGRQLWPLLMILFSRALKNHFKHFSYDVVECDELLLAGPSMQQASIAGIKERICRSNASIGNVHKLNFIPFVCSKINSSKYNLYATKFVSPSRENAMSSFSEYKKCLIVPNIAANFANQEKQRDSTRDFVSIGQIGAFSENKNQLFSLKVFQKIHESNPKTMLYLLGFRTNRSYFHFMKRYIKANNLSKNVVFLPSDFSKDLFFGMINVFLLPSKKESYGIAAVEAQLAGVPSLISDTVPKDNDFGLAFYLSLDDAVVWVNSILNISSMMNGKEIDSKKLDDIQRAFFKATESLYSLI
jgi:glycosyltransferase involved in cell wall biosynthesis